MRKLIVVGAVAMFASCSTTSDSDDAKPPELSGGGSAVERDTLAPSLVGAPIDIRSLTGRIVFSDGTDWAPDWSPGGTRIAYNWGLGTGGNGLYGHVVAPDGSGLRPITRHYVEYPDWSPDRFGRPGAHTLFGQLGEVSGKPVAG